MTIASNINELSPGTDGTAPARSHYLPHALVLTATPYSIESRERERVPGYQSTNGGDCAGLGAGPCETPPGTWSTIGAALLRLLAPVPHVEQRPSRPLLSVRQRDRDEARRPSVRNPELLGVGSFWRAS